MNEKSFLNRMGYGAGRLLSILFFLLPLGYMLLSLGIFDLLTRTSYVSLLNWYERTFPGAFDRYAIADRCFTPDWYKGLIAHKVAGYILLGAMPLVYLAFSRRVWRFSTRLTAEIRKGVVFLSGGVRGCSAAEKAGFLLLMTGVLAYRLYFYFSYPLSTDELCSYLYFVRPGFFISITSYPIPNNHVFFNACCAVVNLVPGLTPKAVMRLPSMAGDLFLLYCIFCLVRRWGGYQRAIVTVAGVAFCYLISYYAVQGRGYQWQLVCVLLSMVSCRECFRGAGKGERRGYALFIVSSVAGFYINPSFLYHCMTLGLVCLYYFIRERAYKDIFFLCRCGCIVVALVLVLYLPLILASSWGALTANGYVTGTTYSRLLPDFRDMAYIVKDITYYDVPGLCFMLACAATLLAAYRKKMIRGEFYDHMLVYLSAMPVVVAIWTLYSRIYPVERSLLFWPLVLNIVFVNACYDLFKKFFPRIFHRAVTIFLLIKIAGSLRGLYWERWAIENRQDVRITRAVQKEIRLLDALNLTSWQLMGSDDFYPLYVREYLIGKGEEVKIRFNQTAAAGDVIFLPESRQLPSLEGYTLWGDKKLAANGKVLRIYVLSGLTGKKRNF